MAEFWLNPKSNYVFYVLKIKNDSTKISQTNTILDNNTSFMRKGLICDHLIYNILNNKTSN